MQISEMKKFMSAMESAIKNENNRVMTLMKEWTDSQVRQPKEEMKNFKAS